MDPLSRLANPARKVYRMLRGGAGGVPTALSPPALSTDDVAQRMRDDWNRRATENGRYYVQTERTVWPERDFFRSGEISVAKLVMSDMGRICGATRSPMDLSIIEIGCGAGRMTRMPARIFADVTGLDVSDEMVSQARSSTADLPNVRVLLGDGATLNALPTASYDLVFSFIVFQHIPSLAIIASYCNDAHRVLRPGGLFKFQVQGDTSVDDNSIDTWTGCPVSRSQARTLARDAGFVLEHEEGAGTQYYWLWFRKPLDNDRRGYRV